MARLIPVMDAKKRDAQVSADYPKRPPKAKMISPDGAIAHMDRVIRGTDTTTESALAKVYPTAEEFAAALVAGDPEIPLEFAGKSLGEAARVYVRPDGTVLTAARVVLVVRGPDDVEKSRADAVDVEATVTEDGAPIVWTGRLVPLEEAVRKFVFTRAFQLRHVSGLTFEFLHDMAKSLATEKKLLLVGTGPKGQQPLIFTTNGSPYRGFLEGRVQSGAKGDAYRLILHLTNLELKVPAAASAAADGGAA